MNEEGKELTVKFLINQLAIEDYNAHHKSLSQLDSTTSVTIDRTEARATNKNELVERIRDRTILEHMESQILVINLETPRDGRKVHEMWKPDH